MSRIAEQTLRGEQRDRADLQRILQRAIGNDRRPKKMNDELVSSLKKAFVILVESAETLSR